MYMYLCLSLPEDPFCKYPAAVLFPDWCVFGLAVAGVWDNKVKQARLKAKQLVSLTQDSKHVFVRVYIKRIVWYALFLCTGETRGLVIRSQADAVQVVDSTSDEMFLSGPLFFLTCTILVPSRSYRQILSSTVACVIILLHLSSRRKKNSEGAFLFLFSPFQIVVSRQRCCTELYICALEDVDIKKLC